MKIKHSVEVKYLRYLDPIRLKHPAMQLAGPVTSTYLENVAFAQLVHIFQPKNFLDLGCYCGALPLMVEDLLELGRSEQFGQTNWYLVDNFSLLREIDWFNKNFDPSNYKVSTPVLDYCHQLRNTQSHGILKNFAVPVDPTLLEEVVRGVAGHFNAPYPNIKSISTDLDQLEGLKFDMVSFDISAENYSVNLNTLRLLVEKYLSPNATVVLDDVAPEHPGQLFLLLEAVDQLGLTIMAAAGKRTVLTNASIQDKNQIVQRLHNTRCHAEYDNKNFWWWLQRIEKYGSVLKMLPNSTYKNANLV